MMGRKSGKWMVKNALSSKMVMKLYLWDMPARASDSENVAGKSERRIQFPAEPHAQALAAIFILGIKASIIIPFLLCRANANHQVTFISRRKSNQALPLSFSLDTHGISEYT
jgi:hypothetical protein